MPRPLQHILTFSALLMSLAWGCASSHGSTDGGTDGAVDSGGSIPRWQRCSTNSECVVIPVSCCGSCGQPTPGDMIGVNLSRINDYYDGRCGGIGCPACAGELDPNLIATCDAGRCQAVDVRTHAISTCSTASDCSLRTNTCCACGGAGPIAIRASADYSALVCDGDEVCPECDPSFPDWEAACTGGHCVSVRIRTPAPVPAP